MVTNDYQGLLGTRAFREDVGYFGYRSAPFDNRNVTHGTEILRFTVPTNLDVTTSLVASTVTSFGLEYKRCNRPPYNALCGYQLPVNSHHDILWPGWRLDPPPPGQSTLSPVTYSPVTFSQVNKEHDVPSPGVEHVSKVKLRTITEIAGQMLAPHTAGSISNLISGHAFRRSQVGR